MENQDYKNTAINALSGHWAQAVLATIVIFLVDLLAVGPSEFKLFSLPFFTPADVDWKASSWDFLISLFVFVPLEIGFINALKELVNRGDDNITKNSFVIGFSGWIHNVWTMFLTYVFIILWTLLLIVPGLIKTFSYAMTPFIVVDHPELSANECIDMSKKMMKGHKFDLFYLWLSFIGWMILCILTLGIGLFWLIPYIEASTVAFYNDVKTPFEPVIEEPAPAPAPAAPEAFQPIVEQPVEPAQPADNQPSGPVDNQ